MDERKISSTRPRKSVAEEPVTSVLPGGEVPDLGRDWDADEEVLAALGYKYRILRPQQCLLL